MDLERVAHMARTLMDDHGLQDIPLAFDRSRVRGGTCHLRLAGYGRFQSWDVERITLSRLLAPTWTEAQAHEVILHEIAHALTPGHDHDEVWRAKATTLGCPPSRYYEAGA